MAWPPTVTTGVAGRGHRPRRLKPSPDRRLSSVRRPASGRRARSAATATRRRSTRARCRRARPYDVVALAPADGWTNLPASTAAAAGRPSWSSGRWRAGATHAARRGWHADDLPRAPLRHRRRWLRPPPPHDRARRRGGAGRAGRRCNGATGGATRFIIDGSLGRGRLQAQADHAHTGGRPVRVAA